MMNRRAWVRTGAAWAAVACIASTPLLASATRRGLDPGSSAVLARYERARQGARPEDGDEQQGMRGVGEGGEAVVVGHLERDLGVRRRARHGLHDAITGIKLPDLSPVSQLHQGVR